MNCEFELIFNVLKIRINDSLSIQILYPIWVDALATRVTYVYASYLICFLLLYSAHHDLNRFKPETRCNTQTQYLMIYDIMIYDIGSLQK